MGFSFGPWRPDVGGPGSGFAATADGVLPQSSASGIGYGPMPQLATQSGAVALGATPYGSISLQKFDGTFQVYFATTDKIRLLTSVYGWTDIETGRSVTSGDDVSFLHFGRYLINTDTTSGMKAYDVEAGGANTAISGAPAAREVFSCNNVIFALDCDGNNRRMQSTDVGQYDVWSAGAADGKTFEDGGALVCGRDLQNGAALVFQQTDMRLVQFGPSAGSALYRVSKVADGRGSVGQRSVVAFDGMVFYIATDGFWKFTLSDGNEPIGAEKVNRWFVENVPTANYEAIQGAVDPLNKVVWWRLSATQLIGYDWQLNEFFTAPANTLALSRLATPGVAIDDVTDTIDSVAIAIGSRVWQGGQPVFGALDSNGKFATFSGAAMAATLRTYTQNSPVTGLISWATPLSDAATSTLSIGVSDALDDSLTWKTPASKTASGRVPLRARGKNIAFEEAIPAGATWTYANGVDHIVGSQGGPR